MRLPNQTLIMLVGPPASGKSTISRLITERWFPSLNYWDIDDIRSHFFGVPPSNDGKDPVRDAQDAREMGATYDILFAVVGGYMRAEHPLLVTCTLSSRKWGQDRVRVAYEHYPDARVRIIWCWPEIAYVELAQRLDERTATGYIGATRDVERAWFLRERFEPIVLPHLKLDTGPSRTAVECAEEAARYILSSQPHDR